MSGFRPLLILQLFLRSSRVQKKRAVLTIAAIAWGSLSLLLMLSFGEGLKRQMMRSSAGLGVDLAILWPGETTIPWEGLPAGRAVRPYWDDVERIRERVPGLVGVSGEMRAWQTAYTYGNRTINTRLTGASIVYGELRNHIARPGGRFLNVRDDAERRRVIFLGQELAGDLFGDEEPVGKTVRVDETPFTVVGVSIDKMQQGTYGGPDSNHGVIPLSTFRAQYGRDRLNNIVIRPEDPAQMDAALVAVRRVLGGRHGFSPEDERAIGVWNVVETSQIMRNMTFGIQIFLGIIGGLTLMVGGIGVANIMYAVVKERTREIGVKMALGARPGWITAPLVLEGLTYTVVGGLLGLVGATALVAALALLPTEGNEALQLLGKPTLSPAIAAANAAVLGTIGLLAGYFPARRAARVDPVDTLRYE